MSKKTQQKSLKSKVEESRDKKYSDFLKSLTDEELVIEATKSTKITRSWQIIVLQELRREYKPEGGLPPIGVAVGDDHFEGEPKLSARDEYIYKLIDDKIKSLQDESNNQA